MGTENQFDSSSKAVNTEDLQVRLEKTKRLLLEEDLREIRQHFENTLKFERDVLIQSISEKELNTEKALSELIKNMEDLQNRVNRLEEQVSQLKEEKIGIQKLAIVLSDLSLQLLNLSNPE